MSEQEWATEFAAELDGRPPQTGRSRRAAAPAEYLEALELARALAQTDFSVESRRRQSLRRRLLAEDGFQARPLSLWERSMNIYHARPALLKALGVALAAVLAVGLFFPARAAEAGQALGQWLQQIVLGDNTEAYRYDSLPTAPPTTLPPDEHWHVSTDIGGFGGNVPPGASNAVQSFTAMEVAQAAAGFAISAPAYLPQGYSLREIKVAPTGGVFLFYGGPGNDIILVETPVGPQPGGESNTVTGVASAFATNGTLKETDLQGRPAAWADGHSLLWEADGVAYMLGGLDLTLDDAKQIALSLP